MPSLRYSDNCNSRAEKKSLPSVCNESIKILSYVHGFSPSLADTRVIPAFGAGPVFGADVLARQVVSCELSLRAPRSSETATPSTSFEAVAVK